MQPHQQRVVDEKHDLDEKLSKLRPFLGTEIFAGLPGDEQARMQRQVEHMAAYSDVLGERIEAFPA